MSRRSPRLLLGAVLGAAGLVMAGCGGGGGGDNPGFTGAPVTVGPASTVPAHPPVPVSVGSLENVEYPQVSGTPKAKAVNAALLADAQGLLGRKVACAVSTLRADTAVLSFQWTCAGTTGLTATFDTAAGRAVTLAEVLKAGYLPVLSATAITQLEAGGTSSGAAHKAAPPTAAAFEQWAVDDQSLQVTFVVGSAPVTISFPLASLSSIIRPAGALGH